MGKYYWNCRNCGLSNPICTTTIGQGASLKKLKNKDIFQLELEKDKKEGDIELES